VPVLVVLLAYPLVLSGPFWQRLGAEVMLGALAASSWNILGGYAGQVSIGHALFYGIGAYAPLVLYTLWRLPLIYGIPSGIVLSALVSLLIGFPTLRLTSHYFTMATIAMAELARLGFTNWGFVGAASGLSGPIRGRGWTDLTFINVEAYYYVFLAVLLGLLLLTGYLMGGQFGFYLRAIKESERASRSLGIPVRRYKLYALMLSGMGTSITGSFYAFMVGFINPDSTFGILISVQMVIYAILGGAGRLFGPLLGAAILVPLATLTNAYLGSRGSGVSWVVYGAIIMALTAWEPQGLFGLWDRLKGGRWVHRINRLRKS
jgi:branched-chain amino acid transport system permease protein